MESLYPRCALSLAIGECVFLSVGKLQIDWWLAKLRHRGKRPRHRRWFGRKGKGNFPPTFRNLVVSSSAFFVRLASGVTFIIRFLRFGLIFSSSSPFVHKIKSQTHTLHSSCRFFYTLFEDSQTKHCHTTQQKGIVLLLAEHFHTNTNLLSAQLNSKSHTAFGELQLPSSSSSSSYHHVLPIHTLRIQYSSSSTWFNFFNGGAQDGCFVLFFF